MKKENQKLKIVRLIEIISRETDENHPLNAAELEEKLSKYGIEAERKSIYRDLDAIEESGLVDIERDRNGVRVLNREFELPELKILVDAVQACRFIPKKQCSKLIEKISKLTNKYEEKELSRSVYVYDRPEENISNVWYSVDKLHKAITDKKTIKFKYTDMTPKKERIARHNGKVYEVSPFALMWQNENYYLVGYSHESGDIRHYRVDKMINIKETENQIEGEKEFEKIDLSRYGRKVFEMFTGKEYNVKFKAKNSLAGAMTDRFGQNIIIKQDGDYFEFCADVEVSVRFYGWVFGFDGGLQIISPECVANEYKSKLKEALEVSEN